MALIDSLISYWKLDEASGSALDSHSSNNLTDTNTVGTATGIINGGRDYEEANIEYHTITDNASLSFADEDFSISCWVRPESTPGSNQPFIVGKGASDWSTSNGDEYILIMDGFNSNRADWIVTDNNFSGAQATSVAGLSAATWYHIVAWHDSVANEIGLVINDGTPVTTSYTFGCNNGTSNFTIGGDKNGAFTWDGIIDEVGIWGKVLTSAEITELYNAGVGLAYPFTVEEGGGGSNDIFTTLNPRTLGQLYG